MALVNVTSRRRCPICGNNTYCAFSADSYGPDGIVCKRVDNTTQDLQYGDVCSGKDGNEYVYIKETPSGFSFFAAKESYVNYQTEHIFKDPTIRDPQRVLARKLEKLESAVRKTPITIKLSGGSSSAPAYKYGGREVKEYEPLDDETLDKMNRYALAQLSLDDWHAQKYMNDKWTPTMLIDNMVRSSPLNADILRFHGNPTGTKQITDAELAIRLLSKFGADSLKGYPGAYRDKNGAARIYWPSGITFPIYNKNGQLVRFHVRMDFQDVVGRKGIENFRFHGNYSTFFSEGEEFTASMKGFLHRTASGYEPTEPDIFGTRYSGKYRVVASGGHDEGTPSQSIPSVIRPNGCENRIFGITEGVPKGIFASTKLGYPFAAILGVGDWAKLFDLGIIDDAIAKGAQLFAVAYDADSRTNMQVAKHKANLIAALQSKGLNVADTWWDAKDGKGIDDLLAGGTKPRYQRLDPRKESVG